MEKILNSIEELYQLITGTLPEGYVEHIPYVNWDMIGSYQYGRYFGYANCYFTIKETASHDQLKIEYGGMYLPVAVTNGKIYKYV